MPLPPFQKKERKKEGKKERRKEGKKENFILLQRLGPLGKENRLKPIITEPNLRLS